jgi:integrase
MPKKNIARPKPYQVGPVRVRAIRGPRADGAWYFRAERYRDGGSETVWTGWGTVERVTRVLAGLVADDRLDEPPEHRSEHLDTIRDLMEVWLAWQVGRGDLSPHTVRNSIKAAKHVVALLGGLLLVRLQKSSLEDYQRSRLREGAATGTVRNEISTIIQAWRWAMERSLVTGMPPRRPKLKHKPALTRYVPSPEEFWAVVDAIPDTRPWAVTMLTLMEATGARPGEVASLCWGDVRLDRGLVRLSGKTGERWVTLPQPVQVMLSGMHHPGATGRLLPVSPLTAVKDLRVLLVDACEAAGVPYFPAKQVRTMIENRLFDCGADPGVVSKQLGHTPEVSLRHYRAATTRRVQEVVELAGLGVRPAPEPDDGNVVALDEHRQKKSS